MSIESVPNFSLILFKGGAFVRMPSGDVCVKSSSQGSVDCRVLEHREKRRFGDVEGHPPLSLCTEWQLFTTAWVLPSSESTNMRILRRGTLLPWCTINLEWYRASFKTFWIGTPCVTSLVLLDAIFLAAMSAHLQSGSDGSKSYTAALSWLMLVTLLLFRPRRRCIFGEQRCFVFRMWLQHVFLYLHGCDKVSGRSSFSRTGINVPFVSWDFTIISLTAESLYSIVELSELSSSHFKHGITSVFSCVVKQAWSNELTGWVLTSLPLVHISPSKSTVSCVTSILLQGDTTELSTGLAVMCADTTGDLLRWRETTDVFDDVSPMMSSHCLSDSLRLQFWDTMCSTMPSSRRCFALGDEARVSNVLVWRHASADFWSHESVSQPVLSRLPSLLKHGMSVISSATFLAEVPRSDREQRLCALRVVRVVGCGQLPLRVCIPWVSLLLLGAVPCLGWFITELTRWPSITLGSGRFMPCASNISAS